MRTPRPVEVNGFARTPKPFPREAREPRVTCALPAASPALRLLKALRTWTGPCHEVAHRGECPQHTARGRLSPELPPPCRGDPRGQECGVSSSYRTPWTTRDLCFVLPGGCHGSPSHRLWVLGFGQS